VCCGVVWWCVAWCSGFEALLELLSVSIILTKNRINYLSSSSSGCPLGEDGGSGDLKGILNELEVGDGDGEGVGDGDFKNEFNFELVEVGTGSTLGCSPGKRSNARSGIRPELHYTGSCSCGTNSSNSNI